MYLVSKFWCAIQTKKLNKTKTQIKKQFEKFDVNTIVLFLLFFGFWGFFGGGSGGVGRGLHFTLINQFWYFLMRALQKISL